LILTKGKKPDIIDIPKGIPYTIKRTGEFIEIEIYNSSEITKLKAKGFK